MGSERSTRIWFAWALVTLFFVILIRISAYINPWLQGVMETASSFEQSVKDDLFKYILEKGAMLRTSSSHLQLAGPDYGGIDPANLYLMARNDAVDKVTLNLGFMMTEYYVMVTHTLVAMGITFLVILVCLVLLVKTISTIYKVIKGSPNSTMGSRGCSSIVLLLLLICCCWATGLLAGTSLYWSHIAYPGNSKEIGQMCEATPVKPYYQGLTICRELTMQEPSIDGHGPTTVNIEGCITLVDEIGKSTSARMKHIIMQHVVRTLEELRCSKAKLELCSHKLQKMIENVLEPLLLLIYVTLILVHIQFPKGDEGDDGGHGSDFASIDSSKLVAISEKSEALECFSVKVDDEPNPKNENLHRGQALKLQFPGIHGMNKA